MIKRVDAMLVHRKRVPNTLKPEISNVSRIGCGEMCDATMPQCECEPSIQDREIELEFVL
jgi:hypothetical protein